MANDLHQVMQTKTKTSTSTYDMKHKSDGRNPADNRDPVTPADWKIHTAHLVDSVYYNMNHAHDHLEELTFSWHKVKKDDPKKAEALAKKIMSTLNDCLKSLPLAMCEGEEGTTNAKGR